MGFSNILTQRNNAPYNSTISRILKISNLKFKIVDKTGK